MSFPYFFFGVAFFVVFLVVFFVPQPFVPHAMPTHLPSNWVTGYLFLLILHLSRIFSRKNAVVEIPQRDFAGEIDTEVLEALIMPQMNPDQ